MFWMIAPAVAGAVNAGITAGANIAANAGSGNTERIRDLKRAKASGDVITAEGKQMVDTGTEQARRAAAQVSSDVAKRAAATGATSGADAKMLADVQMDATQQAYDRAAALFNEARATEDQELEDRTALRRQRTVDAVNSTAKAFGQGAEAVSQMQGLTYNKPKYDKSPDFSAAVKSGALTQGNADSLARLWVRYSRGQLPPWKAMEYEEVLEQFGAGSTTVAAQ